MDTNQGGKLHCALSTQGHGGEGGIRTLDTGFSPYNGLANRRLQPLGHLSSRTCGVAIVAVWGVLWGSWLKHLQLAEPFGLCSRVLRRMRPRFSAAIRV